MLAAGVAVASQPLLQGELNVTAFTELESNVSYEVSGSFAGATTVGFVGTDITNGHIIFTENAQGDVDAWQVTNIVAAGVSIITCDVVYAESGTSTVGMVAGYAAVCALSTNSVGFPQSPSIEYVHLSQNMLNQIRNYAFRLITAGGGSGTITGGLIQGGAAFATSTNAGVLTFTVPTNAASGDIYNATQMIQWVESTTTDTNVLSVTGTLGPDVTGTYTNTGSAWTYAGNLIQSVPPPPGTWSLIATNGSTWTGGAATGSPTGTYSAASEATGTATIAWTTISTSVIWRAGYNATAGAWQITRDGVVEVDATNAATLAQFLAHTADTNNPHGTTAAQIGALTQEVYQGTLTDVSIEGGSVTTNGGAIHLVITAGDQTALSNAVAGITNDVGILQTNTATKAQGDTADAALPKTFTNAASVSSLQVTGGSPTNGAVFMATNSTGQGTWVTKYMISAWQTNAAFVLPKAVYTLVPMGALDASSTRGMSIRSDGAITLPAVGMWRVNMWIGEALVLWSDQCYIWFRVNSSATIKGTSLHNTPDQLPNVYGFGHPGGIFYNSNVTNSCGIYARPDGHQSTNRAGALNSITAINLEYLGP